MQKLIIAAALFCALNTFAQTLPPLPPLPPAPPTAPPPPTKVTKEVKKIINSDGTQIITETDGNTVKKIVINPDGTQVINETDGGTVKKIVINPDGTQVITETENGKVITENKVGMEANDTTRIKIGGVEIIIKEEEKKIIKKNSDKMTGDVDLEDDDSDDSDDSDDGDSGTKKLSNIKTRWLMLDLGVNTYLQDGKFELTGEAANLNLNYGKSLDWNLHLFKQRINLINHQINFLYGLSIDFNNYSFAEPITLQRNTKPLAIAINDTIDYRRNKLYTSFLTLPMMLQFESNPQRSGRSFRASVGGFGSLLLGSRTRQCYKDEQDDTQTKITRDDFNLSRFRYGIAGQIGVGPINFFANYSLTPMFTAGNAPGGSDLYPLNMGITLIGF